MATYQLDDAVPNIHETAFIADQTALIGNVTLGENSSVWFGARIRADYDVIHIGAGTNIQENCVLHTDPGFPIYIDNHVTVGHQATLHGCTIGENTLIGIQAIILNGAVIGKNCVVGAGALVTAGKQFPDNSLILGVPAKAKRLLTADEILSISQNAKRYCALAQTYKQQVSQIC